MHFGLYLKKNGIISAEQFVDAVEEQLNNLVPIGQLALEEGMLSARDILKVLLAQNVSPNLRFGDLAVDMRLLTREKVMRLLMMQSDRKQAIGEILVRQGAITQQQHDELMAEYRHAQTQPHRASTTMNFVPKLNRKFAQRAASETMTAV
jgi:hypothetical protein